MFCGKCGTQLKEGLRFCLSCGREVDTPAGHQQASQKQHDQQRHWSVPPTGHGIQWQADAGDVQDNKAMAIIAYFLFFVPLLAGAHKTSPFAKYHTNQGTVLFVASAVYGIAYGIFAVFLIFIPFIGWLIIGVLGLASIAFLALCIIGIINAANGSIKPLPIIGGITIIK